MEKTPRTIINKIGVLIRNNAVSVSLIALALTGTGVFAALNSPGPPEDPAAQSYTLQQICERLLSGEEGSLAIDFTEPEVGVEGATMCDLNTVMETAPETSDMSASPNQVSTGATYWGLGSGANWGNLSGSGGAITQESISLRQSGQTTSFATNDDGDLQLGVTASPRFADNDDGTIYDNLTGLIWLKDANCFGLTASFEYAVTSANSLSDGQCGLKDGSQPGDWSLPNRKELISLIYYGNHSPALPDGHPFTSVQSDYYWTSSSKISGEQWVISLGIGKIFDNQTGYGQSSNYIWPVRY
jgi:hypothetical protein